MELRRLHRVPGREPYRLTHFGKIAASILAVLGLSLWFAFSKAGNWISRSVFAPLFSGDSSLDNGSATTDALMVSSTGNETVSMKYRFSLPDCYCLQTGVFSSYENALRQAQALKNKGAAGYIYEEGETYRVLAAGYRTKDDCKAVQSRLSTEGIESTLYAIPSQERTMVLTGESEKLNSYCKCLDFLTELSERIYELSIRFDGDFLSVEEGKVQLNTLKAELERCYQSFQTASSGKTELDREILQLFESMLREMNDTLGQEDPFRASFSSDLKCQRLHAAMELSRLSNSSF